MMVSCDTCRAPGSCCSAFTLNIPVFGDDWKAEAIEKLEQHGLVMFVPVRKRIGWGRSPFNGILFNCTRLGSDGRCTDYENRPELCRAYQAGDDALCAEFEQTLKGIPIRIAMMS
jgi:Fe-S-cluster containining protein